MSVVYLIRNSINGKVYVGKTQRTAETRWNDHIGLARRNSPQGIHRAIRKYGAETFNVEVLFTTKTMDPCELNAMETFFIVLHQSHKNENGYNMTLGGKGASGKRTPEQCRRISEGRKGVGVGQKRSPETCERLRQAKLGAKNPNFGKSVSLELRTRLVENPPRLGTGHPPIEKVCPNCFSPFKVKYADRDQVCCSKKCPTELRYKNPSAKEAHSASWTPQMRLAAAEHTRAQVRGKDGRLQCS